VEGASGQGTLLRDRLEAIGRKGAARLGSRPPHPSDQDIPPLIHGEALASMSRSSHRLGPALASWNAAEGAVGHPARWRSSANHLIHHRDKVHPVPSFLVLGLRASTRLIIT